MTKQVQNTALDCGPWPEGYEQPEATRSQFRDDVVLNNTLPAIGKHEVVVETPAEAPAADPSLSLFTAATPYKDVTLELSQNNDDFHDTGDDVTEAKLSALDAALRLP